MELTTETQRHGEEFYRPRSEMVNGRTATSATRFSTLPRLLGASVSLWLAPWHLRHPPIHELHLHRVPPAEFVDDGAVGNVERGVDAGKLVGLFPKTEADAAHFHAMLHDVEGKMPLARADLFRGLGELDAGGTEDGARVAGSEGGHLFNLADDLRGELTEGSFAVDADFDVPQAAGGLRGKMVAECAAECLDATLVDFQPRRCRVAAEADEVLA